MGKVFIAFGGATMTLFIGYATVAATTESSPWYLTVLLIGFVVAGALWFFTGLAYLFLLCKKFRSPLSILDDFCCTYWPKQRQLRITLWFDDHSNAPTFVTHCTVQFGQEAIAINDDVTLGGSYMGKAGVISGRRGPIMVEFSKHNIDLDKPNTAIVRATIKPSRGIWITKRKNKNVQVQVVN